MNGIMQINVTKRPHDKSTVNDDSGDTNDIIDEVRTVRKLLQAKSAIFIRYENFYAYNW